MGRKKLALNPDERKEHVKMLARRRQQKRRAKLTKTEKITVRKTRRKYVAEYLARPGNLEKQRQYERECRARTRQARQAPARRNSCLLDKL